MIPHADSKTRYEKSQHTHTFLQSPTKYNVQTNIRLYNIWGKAKPSFVKHINFHLNKGKLFDLISINHVDHQYLMRTNKSWLGNLIHSCNERVERERERQKVIAFIMHDSKFYSTVLTLGYKDLLTLAQITVIIVIGF